MAAPIERFKEAYKNWRYNPFSGADMAVDKTEDHLFIPGSSPFHIQLLEQPRKNDPTSVTVYCYDDVANFTEVATAPAQSQFRVDYPPADGEGTAQIEFNNLDNGKEVKVNYKATGSPALAEFLDTKVSYPAGNPADHQILGFVSGAPEWRYNPVCYFHDDNVVYHASGEDESCLLFRFKKSAKQATVILELKGAKLHQGYYTELSSHTHGVGTLDAAAAPTHTHGVGSYSAVSGGAHTHAVGTLAVVNESAHTHAKGTIATSGESAHTHAFGTLISSAIANHQHTEGTLAGSQPNHNHGGTVSSEPNHAHTGVTVDSGISGNAGGHAHTYTTDQKGNEAVTITGSVAVAGGHQHTLSGSTAVGAAHSHAVTGSTAVGSAHNHGLTGATVSAGAHGHSISGASAAGGDHDHALSGSTASASTTPKTYPDSLKVYCGGVDKTASFLTKSGLDKLGNGLSSHVFVTTGSGEVEISDWITTPGIHEIKITAPVVGNGAHVLLHAEIY